LQLLLRTSVNSHYSANKYIRFSTLQLSCRRSFPGLLAINDRNSAILC
jgi:hypothetical protein